MYFEFSPNLSKSTPFVSAGVGSCQLLNSSILGYKNPMVTEKVSGCFEVRVPKLI